MGHTRFEDRHHEELLRAKRERQRHRKGAALLATLQGQSDKPLSLSLAESHTGTTKFDDDETSIMNTLWYPGRVTELVCADGAGALSLCMRLLGEVTEKDPSRYVFILPRFSLCAYALHDAGVPLDRCVIGASPAADRLRLCVRALKSAVFSAVLIDARDCNLLHAQVALRRISLAAEASQTRVILLTNEKSRQALPVAVRAHVSRHPLIEDELKISVERHVLGRFSPHRSTFVPSSPPTLFQSEVQPETKSRHGKRTSTHARGWRERRRQKMNAPVIREHA